MPISEKYVIYSGNFDFNEKIAAGKRVLGISYAMRDLDYKVLLVGCDTKTKSSDRTLNTKQSIDGFDTYMLPYPRSGKEWLAYKTQFARFTTLITDLNIEEKINAVIIYGCPGLSLWGNHVYKWCQKRNIKFIADVVDWMPANRGSLLFRFIKWADTSYLKRILNANADGVIAVSNYLTDYYKSKRCDVITVPPITDTKKYIFQDYTANPDLIKFIYVGTPFALDNKKIKAGEYKDRLDIAIKLLLEARSQKTNYIFDIYGITKEEYLNVRPEDSKMLEKSQDFIIFHGKVQNGVAMQKIHEADFMILIRDVNKMTMSGFPTKVSESISCGTPVITNNTSDIEEFIIEGGTGYLIVYDEVSRFCDLIWNMKRKTISDMKEHCTEERMFDYRKYIVKLKTLMLEK